MWMQLIAELGGVGAIAPLVGGMMSTIFGSVRDMQNAMRDFALKAAGYEDQAINEKMKVLDQVSYGKWVVWFIVVSAITILAAGVWYPVLGYMGDWVLTVIQLFKFGEPVEAPTIGLVWYWPTEGSFIFWHWDKLKPFYVGPEDAKYQIAILPTFISIAANAISFFMMNRVRKKQI